MEVQRIISDGADRINGFAHGIAHAEIGELDADVSFNLSPGPTPLLVHPACAGMIFTFAFQSQSGRSYTVEYNDDLGTTNWMFHHTFTGDGSLQPVLLPMTNAPQRFYRVRLP